VEVDVAGVDGFRLQERVASWVHGDLLPRLEALLDSLPPVDGHVLLDRLDLVLDAGSSSEGWEERALAALRTGLLEEIHRKLSSSTDSGAVRVPSPLAFLRGWMHYLEHGALPWNWTVSDRSDLEARLAPWLDEVAERSLGPAVAAELAPALGTSAARRRFLDLSPDLAGRILRTVFGIDLAALARRGRPLPADPPSGSSGRPGSSGPDEGAVLERVLRALAEGEVLTESVLDPARRRGSPDEAGSGTDRPRAALDDRTGSADPGRPDPGVPIDPAPASRGDAASAGLDRADPEEERARPDASADAIRRGSPGADERRNPSSAPRTSDPARVRSATESQLAQGVHVVHAGLVLVGPYLPLLFDRLDLQLSRVADGETPSRDHATALVVLHHLATGRDDPAEFELVLPKVLCGLRPEASFPGPVALDGPTRDEADALLASVVGHWEALKDTRIDGLREAFLRREGKLSLRDGIWRLQVERKPWDLLLEQLPWSLQFTKFPWMTRTLKTEWME